MTARERLYDATQLYCHQMLTMDDALLYAAVSHEEFLRACGEYRVPVGARDQRLPLACYAVDSEEGGPA